MSTSLCSRIKYKHNYFWFAFIQSIANRPSGRKFLQFFSKALINAIKINQVPTLPVPIRNISHASYLSSNSQSAEKAATGSQSVFYHGLVGHDTTESALAERNYETLEHVVEKPLADINIVQAIETIQNDDKDTSTENDAINLELVATYNGQPTTWYGLEIRGGAVYSSADDPYIRPFEVGEADDTYVNVDGHVSGADESSNPAYSTQPGPIYNRIEDEVTADQMTSRESLHVAQN